ncbi:MAG: SpoIIE family protein phosphatase [Ignavibacteriaceae bacterium]|jgi:sigma-B regulation protein RsbU (phosphoserine phosphatase)
MVRLRNSLAVKLVFSILAISGIIFLIIFGSNFSHSRDILLKNVRLNARHLSLATVNKIEIILTNVEKIPYTLAYQLEHSSMTEKEMLTLLTNVTASSNEITGVTIAFEPDFFQSIKGEFAPYVYKNNGKLKTVFLSSPENNYRIKDWYLIPKELGKAMWSEPYYNVDNNSKILATFSVPFYLIKNGKRVCAGVVSAEIDLHWLEQIVKGVKLYKNGYAFLISHDGTFVTYPKKDFIMNETIFSVAEKYNDLDVRKYGQAALHGKSDFIFLNRFLDKKNIWLSYVPLLTNDWSLGVVIPDNELMADLNDLTKYILLYNLLGAMLLIIAIVILANRITRPLKKLAAATDEIAAGNFDVAIPEMHSKDEVSHLAASFNFMKISLRQYISNLMETTAAKQKMESELKIAHEIQMGILPKIFPPFPDRSEVDLYAVIEPAKEVGGDFYDFFLLDNSFLYFSIGDVSGKGVPASLFMAVTKTLIKASTSIDIPLNEIITKVNNDLCMENDSSMFVTIFIGRINLCTGEIDFVNAGHNLPFVVSSNGTVKKIEKTGDIAVGIIENYQYRLAKIMLAEDDTLFLYTDGITEAQNLSDELYSEKRLELFLSSQGLSSAKEIVVNSISAVKYFSDAAPQSDDITSFALKWIKPMDPDQFKNGRLLSSQELVIHNSNEEITKAINELLIFCKALNFSLSVIYKLRLVMEEILVNAISYSFPDEKSHYIQIKIKSYVGNVVMEFLDDGVEFNPLDVPEPKDIPLEERKPGGIGIYLVKTLMDKFEYRRINGKNKLTVSKKLT